MTPDQIDGFPTFGVPPLRGEVFRALSLLTPYDIDRPKLRVGNLRDGAYILAEGLGEADLLSFGIDGDVGFERDLAGRGHRCFMFDHTIERLPEDNPRFHFHRLGISGEEGGTDQLRPLGRHMQDLPDLTGRLILKLDVEGAEWDVFSTLPPGGLDRFDQIVCEFHWLQRLGDEAYRDRFVRSLERLNREFTLFHVHSNNCRVLDIVGGFAVADVLELSYIRTGLVRRRPSRTIYPAPENMGNNHVVPDHALLFYPFLPTSLDGPEIEEAIGRIERQVHAAG